MTIQPTTPDSAQLTSDETQLDLASRGHQMNDSFASVDVSINSRPRARFNAALNKSVIDCGRVKVYVGSVEDVHSLIDDLQTTVREMARHQEAEARRTALRAAKARAEAAEARLVSARQSETAALEALEAAK